MILWHRYWYHYGRFRLLGWWWDPLQDWFFRRWDQSLPTGVRGERIAARHLKRKGLRIILRNHRLGYQEVDLIARDRDTLVFVEVKTRAQGRPGESVDRVKRRNLIKAAKRFTKIEHVTDVPLRFDVVAVTWPYPHRAPLIVHEPHAFRDEDW